MLRISPKNGFADPFYSYEKLIINFILCISPWEKSTKGNNLESRHILYQKKLGFMQNLKINVNRLDSVMFGMYLFYRPERNSKVETHWIELCLKKQNIPADKARRVVEKNWIICLDIMFTRRVMVNKMWKVSFFASPRSLFVSIEHWLFPESFQL